MASRESKPDWPSVRLEHIRPIGEQGQGEVHSYEADTPESRQAHTLLLAWLSELRRHWLLASIAILFVAVPVAAYAVLAVPQYTASGVLQVSSQGSAMNPVLELAGASAPSEVETEVEIIRRREFVLGAFKRLHLHLTDPHQASFVATDLEIALRGKSPVSDDLRRARGALGSLEVSPTVYGVVPLALTGLADGRVSVEVGPPDSPRTYEVAVGDEVVDPDVRLRFRAMPTAEGQRVELAGLGDGAMVESLARRLTVSSVGSVRTTTNLVEISFVDPDRETAQAVVQTLMEQYLEQSLAWQTKSASSSADFIAQRLDEAREQLSGQEETLKKFAEDEHAVQLDTQAAVTIESSAELEAEKRKIELQERVIGTVLSGLKRNSSGAANLTSNFFEDPVLSAAVGALTEAETKYEILRATLTDDHPQVVVARNQIARQQKEIQRLLRSAQKNLTQQRKQLEARIEESMESLSAYPEKELQLARHMRDVEVNQKLYGFLLEKYQEAQILEASTTIDKRIVDAAALPHRKTSPQRAKLVITGLLGGLAFAFVVVYLAHLLQRRLPTVEAVKDTIGYPVYGQVPAIGKHAAKKRRKKKADQDQRLAPAAVWDDTHGPAAEAFRALAVNVSLAPAVPGRGRIVQITSSQPGEGKSTIATNTAIALASTGAKVLLIDLDLRKPVQHRTWKVRRAPGYSDLIAHGGGPKQAQALLQHNDEHGIDILTAGPKLPDILGALMGSTLESMLAYWSERYDYVIVDSPPVFVAGTPVIGRHADLIMVVARPGVTERATARHALESLARLDAHKGLVLNGVERKHAESYYYGGGYEYARTYAAAAEDDDHQAAS